MVFSFKPTQNENKKRNEQNMNKPQLFHRKKTYVRVFFYEIYKCTTCLG